MTVLTLKVPDVLDQKLRVAAEKHGSTKSAIIRKAVERYLNQGIRDEEKPSAFDLISPYVGSIKGPKDLSSNPDYMKEYGK